MDGVSLAASVIGIIQLTGSVVKICGSYLREVKDARNDIITLQRSVEGLETIVQNLKDFFQDPHGPKLPTSSLLLDNITDCLSDLETLQEKIDPGKRKELMRKFGIRALKWPLKRAEMAKIIKDLERYKSSFSLSLQVDQVTLLAGMAESAERIDQNLGLDKLPLAHGSEFDSYMDQHEDECLPGTRTELLHQITEWARTSEGKCIFWLNGMAGTGKSTISRTVAKFFKKENLLGASFFFKRGEGDRGNATKLFPTIARQFAVCFPQLVSGIQRAISDDPSLAGKRLKDQFDKLLLQPLLGLEQSSEQIETVVIVIDALDECEVDSDIRVILQLLPRLQEISTVHIRVFLTSRPDLPIRLGFSDIKNHDYQDLVLHDIPEEVTAHDISLFLNWRLSRVKEERSLPANWPTDVDIQALVTLSVPLFIFAATVCRIFEDPQWDPVESLAGIFAHRGNGSQLDGTYLPVLNRILDNQNEKQKNQLIREFREVVGTLVVLESPLSIFSLSRLTGLSERLINLRLNSLNSIIHIPERKEIPLRLFHLSFRDFLIDPESRNKTPLWVDKNEAHEKLTSQCLSTCSDLKRNICGLPSDGTLRSDIDPHIVSCCLPPELQYSCRFWAQHLAQSQDSISDSLMLDVLMFLQHHFLHWMEAMSILGLASELVRIVDLLLQTVTLGEGRSEILEFLHDAKRFILKNRQIADDAPLQVYCSGLVFAPRKSIIRRTFQMELPNWICSFPDVEDTWNAELQVLEGHEDWVFSVEFSFDSQLLASSSSDNTIRLWDPVTGTLQRTLEGHSDWVRSVAFSPDGQLLASSSSDNTIRLWDPAKGTPLKILRGHLGSIWSVAFSPDGQLLASGSYDQTVRLWDTTTGALQQTLEGSKGPVWAVAFSPDGRLLVSSNKDNTIRLWDPAMGALLQTLEGHLGSIWSVAFSPDGCLLASGSSDQTIRVWDLATGTLQQILEGHSDWVRSVAFSPDGQLLASSDNGQDVWLWDAATGTLLQRLRGHSNSVWSVAFSPDSRLLASGSYDQTVRLWSSTTGYGSQPTLECYLGWVRIVVFSPDGRMLASSSDQTVRIWDPITGTILQKLKGHLDSVLHIAFSPDNLLLASGSRDHTVRLWDSTTGDLLQTLEGHKDFVRSVVFSPDGQLLASGSDDQTVQLWDSITGDLVQTLEGHKNFVRSVVFSPDGQLLASSSDDPTVRLWNTNTGTLQQAFKGHLSWVQSFAFSPDGWLLASGSDDQTICLWDLRTGFLQQTLKGHSDAVRSVTFSPDGQLLVSGSNDQTVRLWDSTTGNLQQTLRIDGIVKDLKFSDDGSCLNTNLGSLIIQSSCNSCASNFGQMNLKLVIRENQWITANGKNVLWLPPEYRPTYSAIAGSTLVLGHASGRISFIGCDTH